MNVQDLINYLQSLPAGTNVTCCEDQKDPFGGSQPTEVPVSHDVMDYSPHNNSLKLGYF
jgi:hypothetical protein